MSQRPTLPDVLTAEELLYLSLPGKQAELVRGRLIVREPPGYRHGVVAFAIAARIGAFVEANDLGVVVAAETGFKLFSDPDTVRAADAAYVSRDRAPDPPRCLLPDPPPAGYLALGT
jgi:Uma2 family endonuclease